MKGGLPKQRQDWSLWLFPPGGPARDASGKVGCRETRFKHELILNGSVKNSAWFRTTPKSEFSGHLAYLQR